MTKILVTSDWHLDAVTAGVPRFHDLHRALDEVVEAVGVQQCDAFAFLGDLCNPGTSRCHRAVAAAARVASALHLAGTPGIWLGGNHDVVEDGYGSHTLMPLAEMASTSQLVAAEPGVYELAGLNVLVLPFVPRSHAYDPERVVADTEPAIDIVAGHLNIEGISAGGETTDMPRGREVFFPYDRVRKKFPKALLLNGHYHAGQAWTKPRTSKQPIYIPGALERLTFGEEKNIPGWYIVEQRKKKGPWKVGASTRDGRARKLITFGPADAVWTEDKIPAVEGSIVRVMPPAGADPSVIDALEADLLASGSYAVKVMPPEPGGSVVAKDGKPTENWGMRPRRDLVEAMVSEANSKDPEALAALTGEVMDEEEL